jgi:hypothetical protein
MDGPKNSLFPVVASGCDLHGIQDVDARASATLKYSSSSPSFGHAPYTAPMSKG